MSPDSTAKKKYISIEEYLQLEEYSQVKHEYSGGCLVEMPGAKYNHHLIGTNVVVILSNILSSLHPSCKVLMDGMKIFIPVHESILYPDVSIICGEPSFFQSRSDVLENPRVIVEVLSESTQAYDRGEKFEKYSSLDSLEEYILIEQDQPLVEVFSLVKKEEDLWRISRYRNLEEKVTLFSLKVNFLMKDVYKNVDFDKD